MTRDDDMTSWTLFLCSRDPWLKWHKCLYVIMSLGVCSREIKEPTRHVVMPFHKYRPLNRLRDDKSPKVRRPIIP
jgi:hypothetical protein